MAWSIEGRYFENCSCEVVCPCTASLALGADYDYCRVALVFHIDSGEVDGVDRQALGVLVQDFPDQMRGFGEHHRHPAVDVVIARVAGGQLERAALEGTLLDELKQPFFGFGHGINPDEGVVAAEEQRHTPAH